MKIEVKGKAAPGITAKDIVLAIIGKTGSAGGTGHVVEFCGEAIRDLSMEGRMTLCNMAIEMGAKAGLVAPDQTTFDYVKGRLHAPKGEDFADAVAYWKTLTTDDGATFDSVVTLQAEEIAPQVTWGTNPGQVISVTDIIPDPASFSDPVERERRESAGLYGAEIWRAVNQKSPLIKSLSVPAPTHVSKTYARRPRSLKAAKSRQAFRRWSYRVPVR